MSKQRTDFYVIHMTREDNIEQILRDGKIYANKYLDKKYIRLWGPEYPTRSEYIYTNLLFCPELFLRKGITPMVLGEKTPQEKQWLTLIFDPKIVYESPCIFNQGLDDRAN